MMKFLSFIGLYVISMPVFGQINFRGVGAMSLGKPLLEVLNMYRKDKLYKATVESVGLAKDPEMNMYINAVINVSPRVNDSLPLYSLHFKDNLVAKICYWGVKHRCDMAPVYGVGSGINELRRWLAMDQVQKIDGLYAYSDSAYPNVYFLCLAGKDGHEDPLAKVIQVSVHMKDSVSFVSFLAAQKIAQLGDTLLIDSAGR